jgi:hypothetical protein
VDLASMGPVVSWASFYANHSAVRTTVAFFHVGGLMIGGGCALAADRATLIASRHAGSERTRHLNSVKGIHRIVTISLVFITISGVLLFGSDIETFLYSRVFWTKMALMALLVVNGAALQRAEHRARDGSVEAWTALRTASIASAALWLLVTLTGVALPNLS